MANYLCEIALVDGPLELSGSPDVTGAGAIVDFFGSVRPLENGEPIAGIEYEAHRAMAEHEMSAIAREAAERFKLLGVNLYHRIGFVSSGESSLFLRVASAHRGAAFAAGPWIVDELKKRVPIWKNPQPIIVTADAKNQHAEAAP